MLTSPAHDEVCKTSPGAGTCRRCFYWRSLRVVMNRDIVKAVEAAVTRDMTIVALTGYDEG